MEENFINFLCANCHTEIQASPDMIGQDTECPACGAHIVIPEPTADNIVRHQPGDDAPSAIEAMKSRTIRIELSDL